jgi:galactose mutarotase-like enzyme
MSHASAAPDTLIDGYRALVLRDDDAGLEAAFVPSAGLVGASLRHRGEELLHPGKGLVAHARRGSTMGIPFLHPWANRLSRFGYSAAGRAVELRRDQPGLRVEEHGLPIHGVLGGSPHWVVEQHGPDALLAAYDFGARAELLPAFPFPHVVRQELRLHGGRLTARSAIAPSGGVPVPLAFGWHPYLVLPGVARAQWHVELPEREHRALDERGLPTGTATREGALAAALGKRTFDDHYRVGDDPVAFALAGGGRRIEVRFDAGYPFAQVFAPPHMDCVCYEPMVAEVDALARGSAPLVEPGDTFVAAFSIAVADA